jgi:hypothetical protein
MDPNQALAELRTLVYIASTIVDGGEVGDWYACMSALIESFEGLDKWLSDGGFKPDAWNTLPIRKV